MNACGRTSRPAVLFGRAIGGTVKQITKSLVRSRGLEPPRVAPLAPQASASTSSATTACGLGGAGPGPGAKKPRPMEQIDRPRTGAAGKPLKPGEPVSPIRGWFPLNAYPAPAA